MSPVQEMATTPNHAWRIARIRAGDPSRSDLVLRCLLAALAVVVCYQFRWEWLRYLTSEGNLRIDALLGVHLERISFDTVVWNGQLYRYVIACTMADVWWGALAFLWLPRNSVAKNLTVLAAFTVGLFAFNVARLSFSDFICAQGVSWNLGHNVVSGICYFLIWQWLMWNRRTNALVE